jgi:CubicO group peptidase (beta-lactamase class C family)
MTKQSFFPILITALFLTGLSGTTIGQKLEKTFDKMLSEQYPAGEPGASILIAKEGEVIYRKAFGMANLELEVPLNPENVFEIGSITKQFTAICILMLMEEGKLSLQDDITTFIPDYPTHGYSITVHHLLTHTSGIKSYTSMETWPAEWRKDFKPMELVDFFKNEPMDFAPGEQFLYNNSAYFLLGIVIEKASGLSYEEFLEQKIFKPLGMDNSYYGSKTRLIPHRAAGYQQRDNTFFNSEYLSMTQPGAAGSIMSTVDDMWIWMQAVRDNALISNASKDKAFTNYALNDGGPITYGYGWMPNEINGSPTLEHGGGIFGYTTNGIWLPEEQVYVIILTNRDDIGPGTISTRIAAHAIGKPYPQEPENIQVEEEILASYTGVYEFEDGSVRYIRLEDGHLVSQRAGGSPFPLFPVSETKFQFEDSFASIEFNSSRDDKTTAHFENRAEKSTGFKTDQPLPEYKEITVDPAILETYVGEYELQPGFTITVTLEDDHLMTQATGQEKFEVFPESETKFFLKVVDAQIEFLKNDAGEVEALMLYQGGAEMRAKRLDD